VSGANIYCPLCSKTRARENNAKAMRASRRRNPLEHQIRKANHDLKAYGLTFERYKQMLEAQEGRCAICRTNDPKGRGKIRRFAVDHCHRTGDVRALLCHRCNGALGMVSDDADILQRMIDYIKEHTL